MSEPSEDPLILLYPVGLPEEGSYYGDESILTVGDPTDVDSYKINGALADAFVSDSPWVHEVPVKTWCNWKFNAKKFTITADEIADTGDSEYYPGLNTYESGANEIVFSTRPVPHSQTFTEGILVAGTRQYKHTFTAVGGGETIIWRPVWSPPFYTMIHKDKAYIHFISPFAESIRLESSTITETTMEFNYVDGADNSINVTAKILETYY